MAYTKQDRFYIRCIVGAVLGFLALVSMCESALEHRPAYVDDGGDTAREIEEFHDSRDR